MKSVSCRCGVSGCFGETCNSLEFKLANLPNIKTPEQMWKDFVSHLNKVDELGHWQKEGKKMVYVTKPHLNFLGSIESYRKIFMEAQICSSFDTKT